MNHEIQPFKIRISDDDLQDLKNRLKATRWPERETVADWSQGIPLGYMQELCEYWHKVYDWRTTEARLNALDQFRTEIYGLGIHFLHIRSPRPDALPLIITHGWPGSIIEFLKVLGPLSNPDDYGDQDGPAFHLVCPSLPGYGFSDKPDNSGWTVEKTAGAWSELMQRLGYDSFFAQGGDWGSAVTAAIAILNPKHCKGIHLNMPLVTPDPDTMDNLTKHEKEALAAYQYYEDWDSGYAMQQSTRPQTLSYGLNDSPMGQAAWIMEKFRSWTDCHGHPENVLSRDELLDNIMLYWLTGSAGSSARLYWESFKHLNYETIDIPVGCSMFPKEIFRSSRRWAEKRFKQLVYWKRHDCGGHFAAFEQPDLFIQDLRACFGKM